MAALCGWLIGRLAFRVRGAYFVIVTISFAEVMRLVALNWVDLTEGPMALNNIPSFTLWLPGLGVTTLTAKARTTGWCSASPWSPTFSSPTSSDRASAAP